MMGQANPNWPKAMLASMMTVHLATATKEVVARLNNGSGVSVGNPPDQFGLGRLD